MAPDPSREQLRATVASLFERAPVLAAVGAALASAGRLPWPRRRHAARARARSCTFAVFQVGAPVPDDVAVKQVVLLGGAVFVGTLTPRRARALAHERGDDGAALALTSHRSPEDAAGLYVARDGQVAVVNLYGAWEALDAAPAPARTPGRGLSS